MKMDFAKPYGIIYGTSVAKFEQGGCLFDTHGEEIQAPQVQESLSLEAPVGAFASEFLLRVLREGRRSRSALVKEAELAGVDGEVLTHAIRSMGVRTILVNKLAYYQLPEDLQAA